LEKGIARAKAPCAPDGTKLVDLLRDNIPIERSLDHAASMCCRICGSVPAFWHAKKNAGKRERFGIKQSKSAV
jgi:hypothetical protein